MLKFLGTVWYSCVLGASRRKEAQLLNEILVHIGPENLYVNTRAFIRNFVQGC
jgi:hypothetical protein